MKKFNIMVAKPYMRDGEQKTRWVKIGSIVQMQDQQGQTKMFGDLDAVPAGAWFDGSIQLFEADQQQNTAQHQPQGGQPQQQGYQQQGYSQGQPQSQQQGGYGQQNQYQQ